MAYAHTLADVDLPHHGGGAHIEPVRILSPRLMRKRYPSCVGRQLLRLAGLHHVGPLGQLEAAYPKCEEEVIQGLKAGES